MSSFEDFIANSIFKLINGKRKITETIFLKDFSKENQLLIDLTELHKKTYDIEIKNKIETDIHLLKMGNDGEHNVYYELKNSFLPMICLHDIRLEEDGFTAQFDFIIITKKFIMVLETKKLNGDIEINEDGDFIRIYKNKYGKVYNKEGIYSPISQNERHIKILKDILIKHNLIKYTPIESAVVIANPKSIVNKKKCPKEIKDKIFKYDQINNLIKKKLEDKTNERDRFEKHLFEIANFLISNHKPIQYDLQSKYFKKTPVNNHEQLVFNNEITLNNNDLKSELKKYRLFMSKGENIKPYMVFTNSELDNLLITLPSTKEELIKVKGFGLKKVEKYGDSILRIINDFIKKGGV